MEKLKPLPQQYPPAGEREALAVPPEFQLVCYEGEMPEFAVSEIDALYGHLYCSPSYFETRIAMAGASLYVARKDERIAAILPYRHEKEKISVVCDYLAIDAGEIERFASHMFRRYPPINRITFPCVRISGGGLSHPRHAVICSEDMVVQLPRTVKEYESAIGKSTRRNIRRYSHALVQAFPSYRYEVFAGGDIREQDLRDIVALGCMRMKSKNIVPRYAETEIDWIVEYAKSCGLVGVMRIDGEVAAGAISFRIGENYFMHVIAHHPKYNEYSPGILCYYHTICEGIVRGGRRFHLLQGRYAYKYRLLAERQDYFHLDIYRSYRSSLSCMIPMLRKEVDGRIRLAKQWLVHDVERKEGRGYRLLGTVLNFLRRVKRSRGLPGASA